MTSLFEAAGLADRAPRPLADRLRPARLAEVAGQDHLLGPGDSKFLDIKDGQRVAVRFQICLLDLLEEEHGVALWAGQHFLFGLRLPVWSWVP